MEFQRKSLGKIRDVSQGGRTVIFVSHNMSAVKSLTTRGLVLNEGRKVFEGATDDAVRCYVGGAGTGPSMGMRAIAGRGEHTVVRSVSLLDEAGNETQTYSIGQRLRIALEFETDGNPGLSIELFLLDASRFRIGLASLHQFEGGTLPRQPGVYSYEVDFAPIGLASGRYFLDVATSVANVNWDHFVESALEFEVVASNPRGLSWEFSQQRGYGCLALVAMEPPRFRRVADGSA